MEGEVYTFCLPDIGEGVIEGEVVEWLKKIGDVVAQDEPVVVVMTDKATVELPSPYPGTIQKQYYQPGQIAIKDKPLYDLLLSENTLKPLERKETTLEERVNKQKKTKERGPQVLQTPKNEKIKAIPKIRHIAKDWNIDLNQVSGSGHEGRVTEEDLHLLLQNRESHKTPERCEGDEEQQLVGIRGLMAKKMDQTHIPQFSYFEQTDATRLIQLRQNIKEKANQEGISLSFMPFFIRAFSLTIQKFPLMNASLDMQAKKVILHKQQHIGVAMAFDQGLIVPVLKNVETMKLTELIKAYDDLKAKALTNKLSSNDMKGASITISNFGVLGGDGLWATPMISDPEVAILAIARMRKAPVVREEQIVVRDILPLSWSFDHRLIDGELAAQISHYYCSLIKDPAALI